jgi:hypothetical protein
MEESGSEGLDDLIKSEAGPGKFFSGIDCFCIVSHPKSILKYYIDRKSAVGQLLAQHYHALFDLWLSTLLTCTPSFNLMLSITFTERLVLLQDHGFRSSARPAFWCLRGDGA